MDAVINTAMNIKEIKYKNNISQYTCVNRQRATDSYGGLFADSTCLLRKAQFVDNYLKMPRVYDINTCVNSLTEVFSSIQGKKNCRTPSQVYDGYRLKFEQLTMMTVTIEEDDQGLTRFIYSLMS